MRSYEISRLFEPLTCPECGITFLVDRDFVLLRVEAGAEVHCPNGHSNTLRPGEPAEVPENVAKLRKEVTRLRRELVKAIHDREQSESTGKVQL